MPDEQNMKSKTTFSRKDIVAASACVILLLANLAAIGAAGRKRTKEAICLSNLRQWGIIWQMYVEQNDGKFMGGGAPGWSRDATLRQLYAGQSYLQIRRRVFEQNPELTGGALNQAINSAQLLANKLRFCPSALKTWLQGGQHPYMAWDDYFETGSYLTNLWVNASAVSAQLQDRMWTTPDLQNADQAPLMLDGSSRYQNVAPLETNIPPPHEDAAQTGNANDAMWYVCINRHGNAKSNILFLDFSARQVPLKQLWKLKWHRKWQDPQIASWPEWMQSFREP